MAVNISSAAPAAFSFGGVELFGNMTSFNGTERRSSSVQRYVKRAGANIEDQAPEPRKLEVDLIFISIYSGHDASILQSAAQQYNTFATTVRNNPFGTLIHPIAGNWQAFCEGVSPHVAFSEALDKISCKVSWIESDIGATSAVDVPNVATAVQDVSSQQIRQESATAKFMNDLASAETFGTNQRAKLDDALALVDTVNAPLDFMRDAIGGLYDAQSSLIGKIDGVFVRAKLLSQDVADYVTSTSDIFSGQDVTATNAATSDTLLGILTADAEDLNAFAISSAQTPGGAAESVGQVEEVVSTCLVLAEAIKAARPQIILHTFAQITNLVVFCQKRYKTNALARADEIRGLNRIPNPSAIPAGTKAYIPSR